AHLAAGVGCATCHGRVDQMEVVRAETPLGMGWCLDCHRDPKPNLRPKDQITNMEWKPEMAAAGWTAPDVHPPQHCSGCHR
ncbi:MAG TPA: cytochrome c3 family protein, partial [Labilithrix sp.]|nr:cytochrome c3 family protein [Labilithrix sp.]